jgi:NAD(P)-dependent dehydrogenase (short-subunit alcohol dehydrogenase family)
MIDFAQTPIAAHTLANAGQIGLTRQFAVEGTPVGLIAANISPDAIVTREAGVDFAQREALLPAPCSSAGGRPEEVVEVAAFLAPQQGIVHHRRELPRRGRHDFLITRRSEQ